MEDLSCPQFSFLQKTWHSSWDACFEEKKVLLKEIDKILFSRSKIETIRPKSRDIFKAFELTPFEEVRIVILGQDPYPNPNQAMGLSFSLPKDEQCTASLRNIFKELKNGRKNPDLTDWAKQGVLLLNSVLTVPQGKAKSCSGKHKEIGWEDFTDFIIQKLSQDKERPKVFILWGRTFAYPKEALIKNPEHPELHKIIKSVHPAFANSFQDADDRFFNNFSSVANDFLEKRGRGKIEW